MDGRIPAIHRGLYRDFLQKEWEAIEYRQDNNTVMIRLVGRFLVSYYELIPTNKERKYQSAKDCWEYWALGSRKQRRD